MTPTEIRQIKLAEMERFRKIDSGILNNKLFLLPCRVKILILVDNVLSFNQFYFGLSEVLDTLRTNPEWWVKFDITRAHRQKDPNPPKRGTAAFDLYGPTFENFRFNQPRFNINDYHQVWFFGFNMGSYFPEALSDAELDILFRWMDDKQGGVFAAGDHHTLGAALCSRIPRIRNMRKWTIADDVPLSIGLNRHDTLSKGRSFTNPVTGINQETIYTFDDESDDIPMKIRLRWYYLNYGCNLKKWSHPHWIFPFKFKRFPHPILSGKKGPIDILPDHPHEGEVIVPPILTETLTFGPGGYTAREYPDLSGSPYPPEIIAWAQVQDDHGPSPNFKREANSKEFGAIGVYNGHCVNVGRVVVDSTWHHWFDVNLTGRMKLGTDTPGFIDESNDPRKLHGFLDTPSGLAALEKIRNYFRNVAIWLSPSSVIKCMAKRALWNSIYRFPLHADLNSSLPVGVIGHHTIDVLAHYAGICQVKSWWPVLMKPELEAQFIKKWLDLVPLKVPVDALNLLDEFMIGGIIQSMVKAKEDKQLKDYKPTEKELERIIKIGINNGIGELLKYIGEEIKTNKHLEKVLKEIKVNN